MKTLILILTIIAFLQTTILPLNLVLIILICRSYTKADKANLYLAFVFGLFSAHLDLTVLGLQSITYLIIVQITESLSKTRLAGNPLLIVPVSLVLLLLTTLEFPKIFLESLLALPILYLIRAWEERFIIRKEIKLRV